MFNQEVKSVIEKLAARWNRQRKGELVRLTFIQKDGMFVVKRGRRLVGYFNPIETGWEAYYGSTAHGVSFEYDSINKVITAYLGANCVIFGDNKRVEISFKEQ